MRAARLILLFVLFASGVRAGDHGGPPTLLGTPVIVVDPSSNSGTTLLRLCNNTSEDIEISIFAGPFVSKTTGKELNAKVTFAAIGQTKGEPVYEPPSKLQPGQIVTLNVEVTNLWEAGESEAQLRNRNECIGTLRALKYRVPFAVSLVAENQGTPELSFKKGEPCIFVLKNDDPMNYQVHWELFLSGLMPKLTGSALRLPPNSTVPIDEVTAPASWYPSGFSGLFRDETRDGTLLVRFAPPLTVDHPSLPTKTIPVTVKLRYVGETSQHWASLGLVLVLLMFGGVSSLVLSFWVPNKLRRATLNEKIDELAVRIRDISLRVDSTLRVQVRVERMRLRESLKSRWVLSPELPVVLSKCEQDLEALKKRVDLLKQVDRNLALLSEMQGGSSMPPTIIDESSDCVKQASELLRGRDIEEAQYQEAKALIHAAGKRLEGAHQANEEFARKLSEKVKQLREDYHHEKGQIGKRETCKSLRPKLEDLFEVLNEPKYENPSHITPGKYFWIDSSIERLFVLRHYVLRFEDTKHGGTADAHDKVKAKETVLIDLLKLKTWNALDKARRLRRQIDSNIFAEDLETDLKKGESGISIESDPFVPSVNQPVTLHALFRCPDYNSAAARREFECVWDFEQLGTERGWEISHYFPKACSNKVSITFERADGEPVSKDSQSEPIRVERAIQVKARKREWIGQRTWIEGIYLAIALGAALLALVAGAREQLQKLDMAAGMIAVFLIGFGADTIKNLLTKRPE